MTPPHTAGQVSWLTDRNESGAFPFPVAFARSFPDDSDEFAQDFHLLPFSPDATRPTPDRVINLSILYHKRMIFATLYRFFSVK